MKIIENTQFNRINLQFDEKPSKEILQKLKDEGWRYSPQHKLWYPSANAVENSRTFAESLQKDINNEASAYMESMQNAIDTNEPGFNSADEQLSSLIQNATDYAISPENTKLMVENIKQKVIKENESILETQLIQMEKLLHDMKAELQTARERISKLENDNRNNNEISNVFVTADIGNPVELAFYSPIGGKTNLTNEDWKFINENPKLFENWRYLAAFKFATEGKPITELTGNEFQKVQDESIVTRVLDYYTDLYNNEVKRNEIGIVILDKEGIKDSLAHGMSRLKASAYAAVPKVIESGIIYNYENNWKNRNYDTCVVIAPVNIDGKVFAEEVVLKKRPNKTGFYLHEVELKEKLLEMFKTPTERSKSKSYSIIARHFDKVKNCNVILNENYEPSKEFVDKIRTEQIEHSASHQSEINNVVLSKSEQDIRDAQIKINNIVTETFLTLTDEEKENGTTLENKTIRYEKWYKPMVDEIMADIANGNKEALTIVQNFDLDPETHVQGNKWYTAIEAFNHDVQYKLLPELYEKVQDRIKAEYEEKKIPYVVMFSSESPKFPSENKVYTVKEFNEILLQADSEFHNRKKYAEEKYGSADNYWDLERDDKLPEEDKGIQFGYDKTNFKFFNIPNPNNPEDRFSYEPSRYDIGDGNGSIFDYVRATCSHDEFIEALNALETQLYFPGVTDSQREFVEKTVEDATQNLKTTLKEKMENLDKAQNEYNELHKKWLIEATEADHVDELLNNALEGIKETYDSSMNDVFTKVLNEYPFASGDVAESEFLKYTANEVKKMVISELYLPSRNAQKAMNAEDYKTYNSIDWEKLRRIWEKFPANVNMTAYAEKLLQDKCAEKGMSVQIQSRTVTPPSPTQEEIDEERRLASEARAEASRKKYEAEQGSNYDSSLSTTDIAKKLRTYVKENYPEYKFSITSKYFSGGSEINVILKDTPVELTNFETMKAYIEKYSGNFNRIWDEDLHTYTSYYGLDEEGKNRFVEKQLRVMPRHSISRHNLDEQLEWMTPEAKKVMKDVVLQLESYNFDHSDSQSDYYHVNFWSDYGIDSSAIEKSLQLNKENSEQKHEEVHTDNEISLKEFIDSDMKFDEEDTILHNKVTGKYVWLYRETGGVVGKFEYDSSFNETSRDAISYAGMKLIVRGAILEKNMDDWTILKDKRYFKPYQKTEMSEKEREEFKQSFTSDNNTVTKQTELTTEDIEICKKVIPPAQFKLTMELTEGEEGEFFTNKLKQIADTYRKINTDKELINEDGSHNVGFRYFMGDTEIYLSEIDSDGIGFGYNILNGDLQMSEWGSTSLEEILSIPYMEMDYHVPEGMTIERMLYQEHPDYFAEYAEKEESVDQKRNADSYTNEILDKIRAAGIEVITDKDEFDRILETEDILQKMTNDEIIKNMAKQIDDAIEEKNRINAKKLENFKSEVANSNEIESKIQIQNVNITDNEKEILSVALKETAEEFISVVYSWENYRSIFDKSTIESPIETIKLGSNQFVKLSPGNRNNFMYAIRQTLENPSIILGKETWDNNSETFKPVHLYGKSFVNYNNSEKLVESLIIFKEGNNIAVSLHPNGIDKFVEQIKTTNDIVYLDDEVSRVIGELSITKGDNVVKENENFLSRVRQVSYSSLGQESYPLININYNRDSLLSSEEFITSKGIKTGKLEITKDNFDRYFNILNQHDAFKDKRNKIASELFNFHVSSENKDEMKKWLEEQGYTITEKEVTQYMKNDNGLTYGFVHNGKIYLNSELMNSNAAVHEYTHLWDAYTQKTNPELWNKGLNLFKDTKYWNEVISDPNYQDIKDDENLVLSEIHSRICGDIAQKVLERIAELDGEQVKLDAIDWNKEIYFYIREEFELDEKYKSLNFTAMNTTVFFTEFLSTPMKDLMASKNINVSKELSWEELASLFQEHDSSTLGDFKTTKETVQKEEIQDIKIVDEKNDAVRYDDKVKELEEQGFSLKEYGLVEYNNFNGPQYSVFSNGQKEITLRYRMEKVDGERDSWKAGVIYDTSEMDIEPVKPLVVYTFSPFGYEGTIVQVETDLRRGIPAYDIVGIPDSAVKETRERIRAAFRNSGIEMPAERMLQALSPADLRKESPMDLAMAVGILNEQNHWTGEPVLVLGELELSGGIRPVRGAVAAVNSAKAAGIINVVCDPTTAELLKNIDGIKILTAESLKEANEKLMNAGNFQKTEPVIENTETVQFNDEWMEDFKEALENLPMDGHFETIRAIEIAVAGKHNILATGAPGCGKTLLTQTLMPALTPKLTEEEAKQITRINSLAGLDSPKRDNLIPPFRMPHQTATIEGICGGGPNCRPGEISLAHNGTLFMDEAAEFRSSVIQLLRVPLESRQITLSRAGRSTTYPADFQLAMAMNPCPCGCYGSPDKICLDSARSIEQYWKKISDPLLDRVEIKTFVQKDVKDTRKISIEEMKAQIATAFEIQRKRGVYNSHMTPEDIQKYCKLDNESQAYLDKEEDKLTPIEKSNLLKLSLTIANMDGREEIHINDIKEARELSAPVFEKPRQFVYDPEEKRKATVPQLDDVSITPEQIKDAENERKRITEPVLNGEKTEMYTSFKNFEDKGVFEINGTHLNVSKNGGLTPTGWKQLQAAMEIYRSKKFETFRYIIINEKNGEIADQLAITSHMPNYCNVSKPNGETLKQVISRLEELGDDYKLAVCHNHPSGNITESSFDRELTDSIDRSLRRSDGMNKFLGHIILDHDTFNLAVPSQNNPGKCHWKKMEPQIVNEVDRFTVDPKPEWADNYVGGTSALKAIAVKINDTENWNDDFIPVVFTNADRNISGVQYYSKSFFENDSSQIRNEFQFSAMEAGAIGAFPVITDALWNKLGQEATNFEAVMKAHVLNDAFTDVAFNHTTMTEKYDIEAGRYYYSADRDQSDRKIDVVSTWTPSINTSLFPPEFEQKKEQEIER